MAKVNFTFTVNGQSNTVSTYPMNRLLDVLRDDLDLTGAKEGCGEGECGACVVFVDGILSNSCLIPIAQVNNKTVVTIEGLANDPKFNHIRESFIEHGGAQCGFCTPGIVMSTFDLLNNNPTPTVEEIKVALSGNICRCTGYNKITDSIVDAIKKIEVVK